MVELTQSAMRNVGARQGPLAEPRVAIVSIDIAGYSILMGKDEKRTHAAVTATMARIARLATDNHGSVFSFTGDGLMATFADPNAAIAFALGIRSRSPSEADPDAVPLLYRVGVHVGNVMVAAGQVGGNAVNIAARLEQIASPQEILLSRVVFEALAPQFAHRCEPLGQVRLKNIDEPVFIYCINTGAAQDATPFSQPPDIGPDRSDNSKPLRGGSTRPILARPGCAAGQIPSLVVLPILSSHSVNAPQHFVYGLAFDIVGQLSKLRDLRVISHGSSVTLDASSSNSALTDKLGVRYILRGLLRRDQKGLRLDIQLLDALETSTIWAQTSDFAESLSFNDQDRIVAQIVNTLVPRVRQAELLRIRGKRTSSLGAYELVVLARHCLQSLDPIGFAQARSLIDQAISADPSYGEAYALAADWHGLQISQGLSSDRAYDQSRADILGQQALIRDPENIRALTRYAHRRALLYHDFDHALRIFDKTLSIAPHSASTWMWSSHTFAYLGEPQEAIRRAKLALQLSPCDIEAHYFYGALCMAHFAAGEFEAAADAGLRALSEPRPSRSFRQFTATALAAIGRFREARAIGARILADQPDYTIESALRKLPHVNPDLRSRYAQLLAESGLPP